MIRCWLEAQRSARRELFEICAPLEIGARAAECDTRTAKCRRAATKIILSQYAGCPFIPCIATTNRKTELFGKVIGKITKHSVGLGVDVGLSESGEATECRKQADIEQGIGLGIEIVKSNQTVELVAFIEQLEFLAQLFVAIDARHVEIDRW